MPSSPRLRHARRVSRLIGIGLALASAAAVGAGGEAFGIRVTGVVMVPGESGLAVVEDGNGDQRLLRAGDRIPGIGSIAEVLPTGVRLDTPKGPRLVDLEWGGNVAGAPPSTAAPGIAPRAGAAPGIDSSAASPAIVSPAAAPAIDSPVASPAADSAAVSPDAVQSAAAPAAEPRPAGPIQATPEVLKAIGRVAATPGASGAQVRQALSPVLDLPEDARISASFPGQPRREAKGLSEVSASLARGEVVRLRVESGGETQTVYVRPPQSSKAVAAAPGARTK